MPDVDNSFLKLENKGKTEQSVFKALNSSSGGLFTLLAVSETLCDFANAFCSLVSVSVLKKKGEEIFHNEDV